MLLLLLFFLLYLVVCFVSLLIGSLVVCSCVFSCCYTGVPDDSVETDLSTTTSSAHEQVVIATKSKLETGAGIAQLVVLGLAVHSVAGSILLWGHFPVEGIFPLELTWVQTPFPQELFRMRV